VTQFTSNIEIQKGWPAVAFEPNDLVHEPAGVWHEDHEIDGVMYRAANATFDDANTKKWSLKITGQAAYAITQNTDGSTSYLYMPPNSLPWVSSAWLGAGQPVIYHAANYGMSPNNSDTGNRQALQAALNAAFTGGVGGIVYIPAGSYSINGTISLTFTTPPGADNGIIIAGAGGSTILTQTAPSPSADLFSFSGLASGRGVRIRDLWISYPASLASVGTPTPAAVRVVSCQNVTCERVFFYNCPQALNLDSGSQQCGMFECTIQFDNANLGGTSQSPGPTMVVLGGVENYIQDCTIRQKSLDKSGPAFCTGVMIAPAGGGVYIANTHVSYFNIGIAVQENGGQNFEHAFLSNVICESYQTSLQIKPTGSAGLIFQVSCDGCVFAAQGTSSGSSTGVLIDTNGGLNTHVTDIFLNNCLSYQCNGAGVQINAGQNIVITGGRYGSNGGGGIAITGAAAAVTIDGADCSKVLQGPPPAIAQPNAISITAAVAGLYVRNCNLTGYTGSPVSASNAGTQIQITDCPGYNDQNTPIIPSTGNLPTMQNHYAANPGTGGTPYYGPSILTFANGNANPVTLIQVHISGTSYSMSFGSIYLPRPIDEIFVSAQPANWTWLGK
jgi:hypothetical protein